MPEMVEHPSHYGGDVPHEVIKCLHAWGLESDALLWNSAKYIGRAGKKEDILQDLKKARFYLDRRIQDLESEAEPELVGGSLQVRCSVKKGGLEQCVKWENHGSLHETANGYTWDQVSLSDPRCTARHSGRMCRLAPDHSGEHKTVDGFAWVP